MSASPAQDAPFLMWAQWYAAHGWPVFPCQGKRPRTTHGLHDATTDPAIIQAWWTRWPKANIGTVLGDGVWALDIDARHEGLTSLQTLEQTYGTLPRTVTSLTGSGGGSQHQLWRGPSVNKAPLGDGLDVQGPGSYIILPPSIHPETHRAYCWEADFGPDDLDIQPPPAWLEALVTQEGHVASPAEPDGDTTGTPILKGTRESTLMSLAGAMRRRGATYAAIRAALDAENSRCVPPLASEALDRMAHSVQRYAPATATTPLGWNGTAPPASTAGVHSTAWRDDLFYKGKHKTELTQNIFNIIKILENHPFWQEPEHVLWWDSVRGAPFCGPTEMTDELMMDIATWFGSVERLPITSPRLLEQCILARCKKTPRDLLQHWLHDLPPWDGTPRLTTWLADIADLPPSDYLADTSRVLLVSMVARALCPGCHYRFVIILEGPEAIGKSSLVRALATPDWFVELSIGLETKEAHMMLQGAWVAELADLDSMTRTEETRMKAFITMREDSYIPKYSNFRQRTERRAIFVGTTNDESYLKGLSGNTRYLPVRLEHPLDLAHFESIRPLLFAEALHYYHAHPETWWLFCDEAFETAKDAREQRRVIQVYEHPLYEWLEYKRFEEAIWENNSAVTFIRGETSWTEIAKYFLKLDTPEKWKDRSLQMQIAAALKGLGWHVAQVWKSGRNLNVWRKDGEVPF
jgi:predicted P-loop ATPase